jgi:hypothetical protein
MILNALAGNTFPAFSACSAPTRAGDAFTLALKLCNVFPPFYLMEEDNEESGLTVRRRRADRHDADRWRQRTATVAAGGHQGHRQRLCQPKPGQFVLDHPG